MLRAFFMMVLFGVSAICAEIMLIYAINLFLHPARFTSIYALILFVCMAGFIPFLPTPSRISATQLGVRQRVSLTVEVTIMVAVAVIASSQYVSNNGIFIGVDVAVAAYFYLLILAVTFVSNFSKLKAH